MILLFPNIVVNMGTQNPMGKELLDQQYKMWMEMWITPFKVLNNLQNENK